MDDKARIHQLEKDLARRIADDEVKESYDKFLMAVDDGTCCGGSDEIMTAKDLLVAALEAMKAARPEERSDVSRHFAICITDLEKVFAYFSQYICDCSLGEAT